MKVKLYSVLILLGSIQAFSQLYVSPSSYVFMTNQYMYVTQDVNIQGTGNFYLRNTSQLLQGGTGAQEPETCLFFKKEQLTIFNTTIGVHQ